MRERAIFHGSLLEIGNQINPSGPESQPVSVKKADLGQFFTPPGIAAFMASLVPESSMTSGWSLLDPGAGKGILTKAVLENAPAFPSSIGLFERDDSLIPELEKLARSWSGIDCEIHNGNFIEAGVQIATQRKCPFSHAILNPPYRKLGSSSWERRLLQKIGMESTNLYSAFTALSLALLKPHGQLVAIIPRSFCNGLYFKSFRRYILDKSAIRHIHLFKSRAGLFSGVLQENVIIHLEKHGTQEEVTISTSSCGDFLDYSFKKYSLNRIVDTGSPDLFFHIPSDKADILPPKADHTLSDLGLGVSTGPIVEFRSREHLHRMPAAGTAPLLYPAHINGAVRWPLNNFRKFNAISISDQTLKMLFPPGFYVATRRLSSKEEKRRIIASVIKPDLFPYARFLGFENHLNIFHAGRKGMDGDLARGLGAYLNSYLVDSAFRTFNGSTQVNATDLRALSYPSRELLIEISSNPCIDEKWLEKILS